MKRVGGGFSLIEILVAVAILAVLAGMTFLTTGHQQRGAVVRQEAEILAATLRRARSLALAHRATYAVVFNLQNAPGSSGAVLNNRSGGHWYRILGPKPSGASVTGGWYRSTSDLNDRIPYAGGATSFPDFLAEVEESWVDEPHVLPARKVRFLALSDTDEGPALRGGRPTTAGTVFYGSGGETTYPRPWFGYFDQATGTLWPWGGYDPAKPTSGFWYQGDDGAISDCRNPATRAYNHDYNASDSFVDIDRNGDGDVEDLRERENGVVILAADEGRPLVNAAWLDFGLVFLPDGRVRALEWNRARRCYKAVQTVVPGSWSTKSYGNGVRDLAKFPIGMNRATQVNTGVFESYVDPPELGPRDRLEDTTEVGHFVRHTGGWHLTLAPDVLDDRVRFPTAAAALESLMPMYRIHVGANGTVSTFPVMHQEGAFAGKPLWPANPADWLSTATTTTGNPLWRRCRTGWLHADDTGQDNHAGLVPKGRPITDVVNTTMLIQRQWWIDD